APVDQQITANYFKYTEGGATHIGGPCEGDSGGPALLPSGAPQGQQVVVGTTSYGDSNCTSYGVSMRVTSQTGPGGFISTYRAGGPSSTSGSSSSGGPAGGGSTPATCDDADGNAGCCTSTGVVYFCPTGSTTLQQQTCTGGKVCGWNQAKNYYGCVA